MSNEPFSLHPIRNEEDYNVALARISQLMDLPAPDSETMDTLETLAILVEDYERKHHPIPDPDPIALLQYDMERNGWTNGDMAKKLQIDEEAVTSLLLRELPLTLPLMLQLNAQFGISADNLIRTYIK